MSSGRIPVGLTFSLFVAAVSLGGIAACWNTGWPVPPGPALLVHVSAGLCLTWTLAAWVLAMLRPALTAKPPGKDVVAVLHVSALAAGLVVVIMMLYSVAAEGIFRTLWFSFGRTRRIDIWRSGFVDLSLVAAGLILAWRQTRADRLITALFWVMLLAGLWGTFQIPAVQQTSRTMVRQHVITNWPVAFMVISSALIGIFTMAAGLLHNRRRRRAWPDRLQELIEPPITWPGFPYSAGVISVTVLLIGCIYLLVPWTAPAAFVAGVSVLALASRRWNENLADAGLALITLAGVALVAMVFRVSSRWWTPTAWPEVFNQAILGLGLMTFLWYWLAAVWRQQLDDKTAWTTTGRLVRVAERVGYLVGGLGVMVSLSLAMWPARPLSFEPDVSTWRWVWGLSANGLLALALTFAARSTRRPTPGWLVMLTLGSTGTFALIRLPNTEIGLFWSLHWPIVLSCIGISLLLLARLCSRSVGWQPFFESVYLTGVFIAPLVAMGGALLADRITMPAWVPSGTFACLTVLYLLASVMPGPRTFLAVAVLCATMSLWNLREVTDWIRIEPVYFYATLVTMSVALLAGVVQRRQPTGVVRGVKWAAGLLAVIVLIAGLIAFGS